MPQGYRRAGTNKEKKGKEVFLICWGELKFSKGRMQ